MCKLKSTSSGVFGTFPGESNMKMLWWVMIPALATLCTVITLVSIHIAKWDKTRCVAELKNSFSIDFENESDSLCRLPNSYCYHLIVCCVMLQALLLDPLMVLAIGADCSVLGTCMPGLLLWLLLCSACHIASQSRFVRITNVHS